MEENKILDPEKRLAICYFCEKFNPKTTMCRSCGCFMLAKVKFKRSTCPHKKW